MAEVSMVLTVLLVAVIATAAGWMFGGRKTGESKVRLEERERELVQARSEIESITADSRRTTLELQEKLTAAQEQNNAVGKEIARLSTELAGARAATDDRTALLEKTEQQLRETFAALAADVLKSSNESLLQLANESFGKLQQGAANDLDAKHQSMEALVKPVQDGLAQVAEKLQNFDRERAASSAVLEQHLTQVTQAQRQLTDETRTLVQALRAPQGRGKWGELQLRRVVELAGMVEHCDFTEQESVDTDGGRIRPDLIVRMPGRKLVVVDSKAPLEAYLNALEAVTDTDRNAHLDHHARQVRNHVTMLSSKNYARGFDETPDFVVLFLPGEAFFSAACERDPQLTEYAVERGVLLSSPTTLIAMLKAISYGWQQERIAQNAEEIRNIGQELYARMRSMAEHLAKIRRGLDAAVTAYNGAVGSIESRVLPMARRFRELGVGPGDEIDVLEPVDSLARLPAAPELVDAAASPEVSGAVAVISSVSGEVS